MKFLIPLILLFALTFSLTLSSCSSSRNAVKEDVNSTCNDSLYLALQKKDSATFTPSESAYFHKFRKECKEELFQAEIADTNITVLLGIGALAVLLGAAFVIAVSSAKPH